METSPLLIAFALLVSSCSILDHESEFINSPHTDYAIKTKVNRSDSGRKDYALLTLFLFDNKRMKLDSLNTHAGDAMAWAVGWVDTNTIVVYSGDIGTQAWTVNGGKFHPITVTSALRKQATVFYKMKYK